jgi:hypothetical protein
MALRESARAYRLIVGHAQPWGPIKQAAERRPTAEPRHPLDHSAEQLAGNFFTERGSKTQVFG